MIIEGIIVARASARELWVLQVIRYTLEISTILRTFENILKKEENYEIRDNPRASGEWAIRVQRKTIHG